MTPPDASELRKRIIECAERARAVDVRPFELRSSDQVAGELAPAVIHALDCALQLCREALAAYDPQEPDHEAAFGFDDVRESSVFEIDVDALVRREDHQRQVADIAFLGVTELRPKLQRIEHIDPAIDRWEAVAECGSALRRVGKSLTALEAVLARLEGTPPVLGFTSQLSQSLEARRQYARLRSVITGAQPTESTLERAMRSAGTAIAMLIGKDIYPELRIHDRRQIRDLQQRILSWLRGERDAQHAREGMRLWQDLEGFAGLIGQISRRQELVEHDTGALARLHRELEGVEGLVSDDLRGVLESLTGLDPELDAHLAEGTRDVATWLPIVARLHRARGAPPPSADPLEAAAEPSSAEARLGQAR